MQDRERKGCGLAGAGLSDADHVAAGQSDGNGLSLDRGGRDVIFFLECTRDWIGKAEILKRGQSVAFYESLRASGRNAGYERVSWDTRVFGASVWLDERGQARHRRRKNDNGSEHAARRDLMIQGRAGYMSHEDGAFKIKYGTG